MEDDDVDFRRPRFEAPTMISEEGRAHPPSVDRTLIRIARGEDVKGDRCRCYGEFREGREVEAEAQHLLVCISLLVQRIAHYCSDNCRFNEFI